MAGRIRSIKPELLDDERAAELSDGAWRLWVSTWVLADDYGNCRAGAKYLAASVWQNTARTGEVDPLLVELVVKGFMLLYSVNDQRYAHINGWEKHQRVDNAGKGRVPHHRNPENRYFRVVGNVLAEFSADGNPTPLPSPLDLRPPTDDHRPTTTEFAAIELPPPPATLALVADPEAPHGRKADGSPRAKPGRKPVSEPVEPTDLITITRAAATARIAAASAGRYVDSPPPVGALFKLDKHRTASPDGSLFDRIGQWLAAGGDGFKGTLDGRNLLDVDTWAVRAMVWDGASLVDARRIGQGTQRVSQLANPAKGLF